jgi:hypothetical protein
MLMDKSIHLGAVTSDRLCQFFRSAQIQAKTGL